MLESQKFIGIVRTAGLCASMLTLLSLSSCSRDPLAPDCFEPNPGEKDCLVPFPGGTDVSGSCDQDGDVPEGAVGARYNYDLKTVAVGGTGNYTNWTTTTTLPPGLTLDPATGIISGEPEGPGNMGYPLTVSVDDALTGENYTFVCDEIHINERLNSNAVRLEPRHCIPSDATKQDMIDLLEGGLPIDPDNPDTDITCNALNISALPCPLGDGNGRPPPGITFDESTCTHSGNISGSVRGTWVWMVEIEQAGAKTHVPFCASNDFITYHDINYTANAVPESDLNPGLLEYDPSMPLGFGNGTHTWQIIDDMCNTDPTLCNAYGFRFDVTCSPFDPPFALNAVSSGIGIDHDLTAMGPTPSASFATRPFVASFEMSYCTSNAGADCDVDDPNFEQNAQTHYHYDVVGFPVLGNP